MGSLMYRQQQHMSRAHKLIIEQQQQIAQSSQCTIIFIIIIIIPRNRIFILEVTILWWSSSLKSLNGDHDHHRKRRHALVCLSACLQVDDSSWSSSSFSSHLVAVLFLGPLEDLLSDQAALRFGPLSQPLKLQFIIHWTSFTCCSQLVLATS